MHRLQRPPPVISLLIICTGMLAGSPAAAAQHDSAAAPPPDPPASSAMAIQAAAGATEVPRNRPLSYTITATWRGRPSQFVLDAFPVPDLVNFDIIETGTSNRVEQRGDETIVTRQCTYTLQPRTLGMGYIEGVVVEYTDTATGETLRLMTGRIGVKVVAPVRERDDTALLWGGVALLVVGGGVAAGMTAARRRRARREAALAVVPAVDVETACLEELRRLRPRNTAALDAALTGLTRLLRSYLARRADTGRAVPDDLRAHIDAMLEKADVYKFSGRPIPPEEFERLYGQVEALLERQRAAGTDPATAGTS